MRYRTVALLTVALIPLLFVAGCTSEIRARYTWDRILIGALIGAFLPLVFYAFRKAFGPRECPACGCPVTSDATECPKCDRKLR